MALILAAIAILIGTSAQAGTSVPVGASGDLAGLQQAAGEPLAEHTFASITQRPRVSDFVNLQARGGTTYQRIAAAGPGSPIYTALVRWARAFRDHGSAVLVTFQHEPDCRKSTAGGAAGYVAAFRKIRRLFDAEGARNAIWATVLMAYTYHHHDAERWWPGDQYIDVVGSDGYNWGGNRSFAQIFAEPLAYAASKGRHLLVAEFGAPAAGRAAWLRDATAWLVDHRYQLAGVFYYNRPRTEWELNSVADRQAFADMAGAL